jgi:histidinol-phosphate aminotransferase
VSSATVRVRANRNESPLAPPSHVMQALRSLEPEDLQRYPTEQLERLANVLAARVGRGRSAIVVGSGADDLLFALARAFLRAGDNVVTVRPTFGMYATVTELAGARARAVPYARRWTLDPAALAHAADRRTKLVILGHPNNPTGEPLALETVSRLSSALPNALVVVDEVYLALSPASLVSAVADLPNVAVVGSLSKSAALAGIRVGYIVAADPVAAALRRAMAPYPIGVASLVAAIAYLTGGAETARFERRLAEQVARSLDAIVAAIGPFADGCWRGAGNFALFDFGERADSVVESLADCGVAVRRIAEPEIPGGVRISAVDDAATALLVDAALTACGRREVAARA